MNRVKGWIKDEAFTIWLGVSAVVGVFIILYAMANIVENMTSVL